MLTTATQNGRNIHCRYCVALEKLGLNCSLESSKDPDFGIFHFQQTIVTGETVYVEVWGSGEASTS